MTLDARLILAGQQPDVVNVLGNAASAAGLTNQVQQQNRLSQLYQQQGPGIMSGDANALRALAQIDPNQALGVQESRIGMDRQRQQMRISDEQLKMAREQARTAAEDRVRRLSAEEAAAEREKLERATAVALQAENQEQLDAFLSQFAPELVGQITIENREMYAAYGLGIIDVLKRQEGPDVPAAMQTLQARAQAAGLVPGSPEYQQFMINGGAGKGEGISMTLPDGTKVQVGGQSAADERLSVSSAGAMIDTINGILGDDALDFSTGAMQWSQVVPGTPMYRFGTRVRQLNGQAFLQAFNMLKGAGQITEAEGQKATEAVGRLDSGQSPEDYRTALTELRDILGRAVQRPRGWADTTPARIPKMSASEISDMDLQALSPEDRAAVRKRLEELVAKGAK